MSMIDAELALYLQRFAVAAVPALLGIILHEVAHGYVAYRCGDPTAQFMGRLTLNPLPHIDPVGLLVFVATSVMGAFVFGWAKPVPVNPRHFRNPARDMMLVALAGPMTNMLLAVLFGVLLRVFLAVFPPQSGMDNGIWGFFVLMLQAGVVINFGLGWLNLLPIPPLDGSKILAYWLPGTAGWQFMRLERYGFVILLLLLATGLLGYILQPLVAGSSEGLLHLLGL